MDFLRLNPDNKLEVARLRGQDPCRRNGSGLDGSGENACVTDRDVNRVLLFIADNRATGRRLGRLGAANQRHYYQFKPIHRRHKLCQCL